MAASCATTFPQPSTFRLGTRKPLIRSHIRTRKPLIRSHIRAAFRSHRSGRPLDFSSESSTFKWKGWLNSSKDISYKLSATQVDVEDNVEDDDSCELVSGIEITLGEDEDAFHAYLLKAVKNNNGTGVLLLSDIFGFEDSFTREFAYRVACSGYNVLVPDLFRGEPWGKDRDATEFESWLANLPADRIAKDIATSSSWMAEEFVAAGMSMKLGIIGFCFGGGHLIQTLARDNEAHFGAGICFCGTHIDPSLAKDIKIPVLFINGYLDSLCPINIVQDAQKNISGSKLVVYQDRGHGFALRPQSQEEDEDAEEAFVSMRHWLHDFLVVHKAQLHLGWLPSMAS